MSFDYKDASIGVLGPMAPERSEMDKQMQAQFGWGVVEAYNSRVFGPRTGADMRMQMEFNPYFRQNMAAAPKKNDLERFQFRNVKQTSGDNRAKWPGVQNRGVQNLGVQNNGLREMYQAEPSPYARLIDNPYNPDSTRVQYVPLRP